MRLKELKQMVKERLDVRTTKEVKETIWKKYALENIDLRRKENWQYILDIIDNSKTSENNIVFNSDGSVRHYKGFNPRCSNQAVLHAADKTPEDDLITDKEIEYWLLKKRGINCQIRWNKGEKPTVKQFVEYLDRTPFQRVVFYVNGHALGYNKNKETRLLDTEGKGFSQRRVYLAQIIK